MLNIQRPSADAVQYSQLDVLGAGADPLTADRTLALASVVSQGFLRTIMAVSLLVSEK